MNARVVRRKTKQVTVRVDEAMHAELRVAAARVGMPVAGLARAFLTLGLATLQRGGVIEGIVEGRREARVQRTVRGSRDTDKPTVKAAGDAR